MSKNIALSYRLMIFFKFILAFGLGYIFTVQCIRLLNLVLHPYLPQAEHIYLSVFIGIFIFLGYVIAIFLIHSFKNIVIFSSAVTLLCFLADFWITS